MDNSGVKYTRLSSYGYSAWKHQDPIDRAIARSFDDDDEISSERLVQNLKGFGYSVGAGIEPDLAAVATAVERAQEKSEPAGRLRPGSLMFELEQVGHPMGFDQGTLDLHSHAAVYVYASPRAFLLRDGRSAEPELMHTCSPTNGNLWLKNVRERPDLRNHIIVLSENTYEKDPTLVLGLIRAVQRSHERGEGSLAIEERGL